VSGVVVPGEEARILRQLDDAIRQPRAAKLLNAVANKVDEALESDRNARLAWEALPLSVYDRLPPGIASSWIFALRADSSSGAERHPNSVQRFMSYRGSADMQTWNGSVWVSHVLRSEPDVPFEQRWLSIPTNTWHKPVMGGGNWLVVSFHTAADDELIEERPADDAHPDVCATTSELYDGRAAR
jgi:hypothetical protein